jgi:hypothetical protein
MFSYWLLCIAILHLPYMPISEDLPTHHVTQMGSNTFPAQLTRKGLDKISSLYVLYVRQQTVLHLPVGVFIIWHAKFRWELYSNTLITRHLP